MQLSYFLTDYIHIDHGSSRYHYRLGLSSYECTTVCPIFHPFVQHPLHLAHQQEYREELQNWD